MQYKWLIVLMAAAATASFFSGCYIGDPESDGPKVPEQYILQEGLNGYSGSYDTMMSNGDLETNFGLSDYMRAGYWSDVTTRTLLKFDVSSIPEDAEVVAATLRLVSNNIASASGDYVIEIEIFEADTPWSETEATWQNATDSVPWTTAGGDFSGQVGLLSIPRSIYESGDAVEVALDTTVVQRWVANSAENLGMALRNTSENTGDPDTENSFVVFYTKARAAEAERPRLTIEAHVD